MAYRYPNIEDHLRSRGFRIAWLEPGQGERFCGAGGTSFHCVENGAAARDWGNAAYTEAELWAIFDALLPYAKDGTLAELFFHGEAWRRGVKGARQPDHDDHVHSALAPGRLLPILAQPVEPPKPKTWLQEEPLTIGSA